MDDRVQKLEERIAHQEHTIAVLNDEVFQQQQQLDTLQLMVKELSERFKNFSDASGGGTNDDEPPPHY